jgi:hypothetical protein
MYTERYRYCIGDRDAAEKTHPRTPGYRRHRWLLATYSRQYPPRPRQTAPPTVTTMLSRRNSHTGFAEKSPDCSANPCYFERSYPRHIELAILTEQVIEAGEVGSGRRRHVVLRDDVDRHRIASQQKPRQKKPARIGKCEGLKCGRGATAIPALNIAIVAGPTGYVSDRCSLASPAGFEPTAPGLGILCSILLSYGDSANASSTGGGRCQYAINPAPAAPRSGRTGRYTPASTDAPAKPAGR